MHTLALPDVLPSPAVLDAFRGRETLSGSYRFEIDLRETPELDGVDVIGRAATLCIVHGERRRELPGLIVAARRLEPKRGGPPAVRLTLASRLSLLRLTRRSRIFQDQSVDQIVDAVLGGASIASRWHLAAARPVRAYVTQYEETDFAFLCRLLGEDGIAFRHETAQDGRDALVLGDTPAVYDRSPLHLRYVGETELVTASADVLTHFSTAHRLRPSRAVHREYDYERPRALIESRSSRVAASKSAEDPPTEIYDHHRPHLHADWHYAATAGDRLLAGARRRARTGSGVSTSPAIQCGRVITVDAHPHAALNRDYTVIAVSHRGWRAARPGRGATYQNAFDCIPDDTFYPPSRPQRRNVAGSLTGVVVGPPGAEIHADAMARVKVQFPWDRDGANDAHSSTWLRTMQAWGGEAWGTQFLPRVGMEVVVTFEGGDPNRPLVLGCVYNGTHPAPFGGSGDAARSGFRTRSTPGSEGYNELSFCDQAGQEEVRLRAQRNLVEHAGGNLTSSVEHDRVETTGGDALTRVTGARLDETLGRSVTKTAGDHEHHVGGRMRAAYGEGRQTVVAGDDVSRISGRAVTHVKTRLDLGAGERIGITAGTHDRPGALDVVASGNVAIGAQMAISLRAEERIVLSCGDSYVEIGPRGITLRAPSLSFAATDKLVATTRGCSIGLDEAVRIAGEEVRIHSAGASVDLDTEAHIDGALVKLACAGSIDTRDEDGNLPATRPLRLRVAAHDYAPHSHKPFVVKAGGALIEGTTDGDGLIDVVVPAGASGADVTVWLGKRGSSETRHYVIALTPVEPETTVRGLQERLRHLGYYHREPTGELDTATLRAIRSFQRDRGLAETATADEATRAKLVELHGS